MTLENKYVTMRESGDVLVLSIGLARINSFEVAEAIGKALISAALQKPAPKVVVDLSQLEYMSSVGYGPLISLRAAIQEAGGRLVICGLSAVIKELFEATRLLINPHSPGSLFEFTDTVPAAVARLSDRR
jgi:anti-anti-sigma factor